MNVVMTGAGAFVEVQGTAEQTPFVQGAPRRAAGAGRATASRRLVGAAAPRPRGAWREDLHPLTGALVLATANRAKGREMAALLGRRPVSASWISPTSRASRLPPEGETSYAENALGKARAVSRATGLAGAGRRLGHRGGRARRRGRACSPRATAARGSTIAGRKRDDARASSRACRPRGAPPAIAAVIALSRARRAARRSTEGVVEGVLLSAAGRRRLRLRSALLLSAARRHLRRGPGRGQARGQPPRPRDGAGATHPGGVAAARRVAAGSPGASRLGYVSIITSAGASTPTSTNTRPSAPYALHEQYLPAALGVGSRVSDPARVAHHPQMEPAGRRRGSSSMREPRPATPLVFTAIRTSTSLRMRDQASSSPGP